MNESSPFSPDSGLMDEILNEMLSLGLEIANEVIDFMSHGVFLFPAGPASSTVRLWHYLDGFQTPAPERDSLPEEDLLEAYRHGFYFFGYFQKHRTAHRESDYWKVIEEKPDWAKQPWRKPDVRSVLTLPLFRKDSLIGIIRLFRQEPNDFLKRDEDLATCLARLLSQALFDAEIRTRLWRLKVTMLHRRIARFGELNLRQIGNHYAEWTVRLLHPEVGEAQHSKKIARSSVRLLDEARRELCCVGTYDSERGGEWPENLAQVRRSVDGQIKSVLAWQRREPVIVQDAQAEPEYPWLFKDTKSLLVAPICPPRQEQPIGVLNASVTDGVYTENDKNLLWLLAAHLSGPVGAAHTRERLERQREQLQLLAAMSQTMQSTGSLFSGAKLLGQPPFRQVGDVLAQRLFEMGYRRVLLCTVDWAKKLVLGAFGRGDESDELIEELCKRTRRRFDDNAEDVTTHLVPLAICVIRDT